jgi:hypothetical protein
MILVILETLIVKGGITIAHWLAAHGTNAMALKGGALIAKSITTQGLVSTLAGVTGLAVGSSLLVGGYLWTTNHVKTLGEILAALNKGDYKTFCFKCAKLCMSFNVDIKFLPDVVQDFLIEKAGFSIADASNIANVIRNSEDEILKFMNYR